MMLAGVACAGAALTGAGVAADGFVIEGNVASFAAGADAGGGATPTFPSLKPASCRVRLALPSGCPRKLGMVKTSGSAVAVSSKLIFGAATWLAFAAGLCDNT